MAHSRFSEEQIIGILKEQEADKTTVDLCRRDGVSTATPGGPQRPVTNGPG